MGDTAYILESNHTVREVQIRKYSAGIYLIRFMDGSGGIRVKVHRLFTTKEEADSSVPKKEQEPKGYRSPYDYEIYEGLLLLEL